MISELYAHLRNHLPNYTIPIFIRISSKLETTGTHKYKKVNIREEGYDINRISDSVYVLLPNADTFRELTDKIYHDINEGRYHY